MIKIESTTETMESKGGLLLAGKIARKAGLGKIRSDSMPQAGNIITSMFGIMAEGNSDFESMKAKRGDLFFKEALDLKKVYTENTIRPYFDRMADDADAVVKQLRESSIRIMRTAPLHGLWIRGIHYLPVDIDTTTMDNSDTKKEGVSRTYQGYDGYQPILAYAGKEGYMLDSELRPGSQHCQKGTPEFIRGLQPRLRSVRPHGRFLFRLDSGNDAFETIRATTEEKGQYCIIKRNKRQERDENWLRRARRHGVLSEPREGKKVWRGTICLHPRKDGETLRDVNIAFEVTERKIDSNGDLLLIPKIEVNTWWTNLDCPVEKVIELYHGHATSEQFHSELKHDMGIERLPSGKMAVNRMLFAVAMNAYNALRLIGQTSIDKKARARHKRKRLGTIIRDLVCVAGKLVRHARELVFKIYYQDPVLPVFQRLDTALDGL
jgi:hypothetical protein